MKVDELRVLEADELSVRMRQARRELYELRFKHAVGQLENSSQISKVRHDIARIMTVLRERDFGIVASMVADALEPAAATAPHPEPVAAATAAEEAPEAPAAKPKRTRKKAEETK
jgi:large subunit ribosomal protein L29